MCKNFAATAYHLAFSCNVACNISWQHKVFVFIECNFLTTPFRFSSATLLASRNHCIQLGNFVVGFLLYCFPNFSLLELLCCCSSVLSLSLSFIFGSGAFIINAVVMTKLTILLPSRVPTSTQRRLVDSFLLSRTALNFSCYFCCAEISFFFASFTGNAHFTLYSLLAAIYLLICSRWPPFFSVSQLFRCSTVALIM